MRPSTVPELHGNPGHRCCWAVVGLRPDSGRVPLVSENFNGSLGFRGSLSHGAGHAARVLSDPTLLLFLRRVAPCNSPNVHAHLTVYKYGLQSCENNRTCCRPWLLLSVVQAGAVNQSWPKSCSCWMPHRSMKCSSSISNTSRPLTAIVELGFQSRSAVEPVCS